MTTWQRIESGLADARLTLALNRWGAQPLVMRTFRCASRLGDGMFWYVLMLGIAMFGGAHGPAVALQMALTGLVAALLYRGLKRWTRRPRPFRAHPDITALAAPLDEFSFPSGHTLHAVSFSLVALAHIPELAPLLLPFTLAVALSRVVLGLHYPSDVLAAAAIGSLLAGASLWLA